MFTYKTTGVCSSTINIEIVNNVIESVEFIGGCAGESSRHWTSSERHDS